MVWAGAGLTIVAVAGLGVYFALVGLDKADKLASVVGALAAVVGLASTIFGLTAESGSGGWRVSQTARASRGSRVVQVGGNQTPAPSSRNVKEGEVHQRADARKAGEVFQVGGDQNPETRS